MLDSFFAIISAGMPGSTPNHIVQSAAHFISRQRLDWKCLNIIVENFDGLPLNWSIRFSLLETAGGRKTKTCPDVTLIFCSWRPV